MATCIDMASNTRQRLLYLMVARVGRLELSVRLRVPPAVLHEWLNGQAPIPDAKLVALIDLIDATGDPCH